MYPQVLEVKEIQGSDDLLVKSFLISSDVNVNNWWVKPKALEKYVEGFVNKPAILHPSKDHPDYSSEGVTFGASDTYDQMLKVQQPYEAGPIVKLERRKDMAYGWDCYQRITNPALKKLYQAGAFPKYVSPMVYSPTPVDGSKGLEYFEPLHLAYVDDPAYGSVATVKGHCLSADQHCLTNLHAAKTIQKDKDGKALCQKGVLLTFKNLYSASDLHSYYFDNHTKNSLESKLVDDTQPTKPNPLADNASEGNKDNTDNTPKPTDNKNNDDLNAGNKDPSKDLKNTPDKDKKDNEEDDNKGASNGSGSKDNNDSSSGKSDLKAPKDNHSKEDDFETKLQKSEAFQKLIKENEELKGFKKSAEEDKVKAEGAKKLTLIETYINEATVPDPTTRKERIDKIKAMNISGDDLKFFLQESYAKKLERATVKGASVNNRAGIARLIFGAAANNDSEEATEIKLDAKELNSVKDLF